MYMVGLGLCAKLGFQTSGAHPVVMLDRLSRRLESRRRRKPTGGTRRTSGADTVMVGIAIVAATRCDRGIVMVRRATSDGGMCLD